MDRILDILDDINSKDKKARKLLKKCKKLIKRNRIDENLYDYLDDLKDALKDDDEKKCVKKAIKYLRRFDSNPLYSNSNNSTSNPYNYYDQTYYNYISRDLANVPLSPPNPQILEAYGRTVQEIMQVFFMGINYGVHFASLDTFNVLVMLKLQMIPSTTKDAYSELIQLQPFRFTVDYWTTGSVHHYLVIRTN